jgi:FMN reductase
MVHRKLKIVGIGGTTRVDSSSERALRFALDVAAQMGAETLAISGAALEMEAYDPARPDRTPASQHLVAAVRDADGLILATPSYHGSVSGLIKNALDHVEDLREDVRPYLEARAVGCIVCAQGTQSVGLTLVALRSIVHALRGWPTPYAASIDVMSRPFGPSGREAAPQVAESLRLVASQVMEFALMQRAYRAAQEALPRAGSG